jgi:type IV pilus assembly protein PilW
VRNLVGIPVQVYDSNATCSAIVTDKQATTDVLVVRHADTCRTTDGGNCEADVAGSLYFQTTQCGAESATPYVLGTTGFTLHKRDCTAAAAKRKFVSNLYYIRDYAVTAGDGIPTLMRSQFENVGGAIAAQNAVALIEGIEGFHVELGVDDVSENGTPVDYSAPIDWVDDLTRVESTNRGDGVPDGDFVSCTTATPCTAAQLTNVTAVKLYLLVRSRDESPNYTDTKTYNLGTVTMGPYNDHFRRHVFATVIRLPNIAGRRITP